MMDGERRQLEVMPLELASSERALELRETPRPGRVMMSAGFALDGTHSPYQCNSSTITAMWKALMHSL